MIMQGTSRIVEVDDSGFPVLRNPTLLFYKSQRRRIDTPCSGIPESG